MDKDNENNLSLNNCFENVKMAVVSEPYPPIKVEGKNRHYADLLSVDFTGAVSEFTAVTQYVNHEIRLKENYCNIAETVLSISISEMMHMDILGELIVLLGSSLTYNAYYCKKKHLWTPKYVEYKKTPRDMILSDIKAEEGAIAQYKDHIKRISDVYITNILKRIIKDEEHHINLFNEILESLEN